MAHSSELLAFALTLLVALSANAAPTILDRRQASCSAAHIIVTRGTFESDINGAGGFMGTLATAIQQRVPGSDVIGTTYPANANPYNASEASGVSSLTQSVESYVARCPQTPIVLLGYSQGAQVVSNVICGTDDGGGGSFGSFAPTPKLDFAAYGSHIKAIALWGDPTYVANQSYNKGSQTHYNGIFGRNNVQNCQQYAPIMGSWCADGDLVCEKDGTNPGAHLSYVFTYTNECADFVVQTLQSAGVQTTSATGSPFGFGLGF